MSKVVFKSNRYFTISDFMVSHGQLLIRANKDDAHLENIDIIFFSTKYIQLSTYLSSLSIRQIDGDETILNHEIVKHFLDENENNLFEIKTKGGVFYVIASYFKVYRNTLEFNETSLGLDKPKGREREIEGSY